MCESVLLGRRWGDGFSTTGSCVHVIFDARDREAGGRARTLSTDHTHARLYPRTTSARHAPSRRLPRPALATQCKVSEQRQRLQPCTGCTYAGAQAIPQSADDAARKKPKRHTKHLYGWPSPSGKPGATRLHAAQMRAEHPKQSSASSSRCSEQVSMPHSAHDSWAVAWHKLHGPCTSTISWRRRRMPSCACDLQASGQARMASRRIETSCDSSRHT